MVSWNCFAKVKTKEPTDLLKREKSKFIHILRTQLTSFFGGLTFPFMGQTFQNSGHLASRSIHSIGWCLSFFFFDSLLLNQPPSRTNHRYIPTITHRIHVWYIYTVYTDIYHKNQLNVGKYTIHGAYMSSRYPENPFLKNPMFEISAMSTIAAVGS